MSVAQHLFQAPTEFDFAQAIRILQAVSQQKSLPLHYISEPIPYGAPADLTQVKQDSSGIYVRLGLEALSGCKGVIPDYLYSELLDSLHQDNEALQRFLDVFNQRYFDLIAYVESAANLMLREEREQALGDAVARLSQVAALKQLFSLPKRNGAVHDSSMLRYGFMLASKSRSLAELKRLLCDYFKLDIVVQATPAKVYRMHAKHQTRIGTKQNQNNKLGHGVLLGKTGQQAYKSLEVYITPRSRKEYLGLLKDRHFAQSVGSLMNTFLRETVSSKLYLYVKREFIDAPLLSSGKQAFRLGEANCLAPSRHATDYRKILIQSETL